MKNLLLIFLLSSCAAFAQEDFSYKRDSTDYNTFKEHVPYWRMEKNWKFSPFDLLSIIPTFGVDHEVKMNSRTSFQFGAAFIPSFMQFTVGNQEDQFKWMNGYRLRYEARFFGFKRPAFYLSTEISLRHLIISDETAFGMEQDQFGNYAYFINQNMIYHRFTTAFNIKMGWQKVLSSKLVIDAFLGVSFRRNNVVSGSKSPEGGVPQAWWNRLEWNLSNGHNFGYATPIVGFRLGIHKPARADI